MNRIENKSTTYCYDSNPWKFYTGGFPLCFFDIETSGLSPRQDITALAGISLFTDELPAKQLSLADIPEIPENKGNLQKVLACRQYFSGSPAEEKALVEATLSELAKNEIWITYNGDSFDLPFLEKRAQKLGLAEELPFHHSLDLFRILKKFSMLPKILPDLKQKSVENYISASQSRTDRITGAESAAMYQDYLETGDNKLKNIMLLHNLEDISQLPTLLQLFTQMDIHRIMSNRGFLIAQEEKRVRIDSIKLNNHVLLVEGLTKNIPLDYHSFEESCEVLHQANRKLFQLKIPCDKVREAIIIDLELFGWDFAELQDYPAYESGYLVLKNDKQINYMEINHALKLIIAKIMSHF